MKVGWLAVVAFAGSMMVTAQVTAPVTTGGPAMFGPSYSGFPAPVAPGQLAEFFVSGLTLQAGQPTAATSFPLPSTLAGITASIRGFTGPTFAVPILRLDMTRNCNPEWFPGISCSAPIGVEVQLPYELGSSPAANVGNAYDYALTITDAQDHSASITLHSVQSAIHVLRSCEFPQTPPNPKNACPALVSSAGAETVAGAVVTAYATGLGRVSPGIPTGSSAPASPLSGLLFPVGLNFDFHPNAQPIGQPAGTHVVEAADFTAPLFAGPVPGYAGLYQVNIRIPDVPIGTPACGGKVYSNLTVTILNSASSDGFPLCVAVPAR
jgi:uncharacterized protein (TIGR03437 family)